MPESESRGSESDVGCELESFLKSRDDPLLIKGDVLRVMCMYRRLWLSEVVSEIASFRSTLGEEIPGEGSVREAVQDLARSGFLHLQKGLRASFVSDRGVEDVLVTLTVNDEAFWKISFDGRLREYRRVVEELLDRGSGEE